MHWLFAQAVDTASTAVPQAAEAAANVPQQATQTAQTTAETAAAGSGWLTEILNSGLLKYMNDGGLFMWPILILGILAAGVIIERVRSLRMLNTNVAGLRRKVVDLLQENRVEEALAVCDKEEGPVPAILGAGLRKLLLCRRLGYDAAKEEEQVRKAMEDYGVHIVAALERHLPILATIASAAPMLGFLGTVAGMIVSFADIVAKIGTDNIVKLAAGGIQVALLTTAFGLIVGIPAYVGFNYFTGVVNRFVLDVQDSASELIETVMVQMAIKDGAIREEPATVG